MIIGVIRLMKIDYYDQCRFIMFGMGENSIIEVAEALDSGLDIKYLTYLDGTVYKTKISMI